MASVSIQDRARLRSHAFDRLLDELHEGVFVGVRSAQVSDAWVTVAANRHLRDLLGYAQEAPEAEVSPFATRHFDDATARNALIEQLTRDGEVSDCVMRMRRADQSVAWIAISARLDRDPETGAAHLEALMRDAGERRRLDDRRRELDEHALQADKMAVLGQAISGVAHELNNPLATIVGWAERISEQDIDPVTKRGVDVILGEAERAARIVRNLLTFARKRPSTRATVDINQIVLETLALRSYEQPGARIALVTALGSDLPTIFADTHQVQQVLLNLVINAEQAVLGVRAHGSIVVRTWHDARRGSVVLEVNDDGPGVAGGIRERIFDPFFTTKESGKGTGLGLTVAYAIVREHGGRIRVDSSPGRGASFVVEFPAASLGVAEEIEPSSQAVQRSREASVLVVEPGQPRPDQVWEALTQAGWWVDHASDGEEALARVRARSYDVVICALDVPRIGSGRMLYRAMAAATPALARRVVFVAEETTDADTARFLVDCGCRCVVRPLRTEALVRAVRDALG